MELINRRGFLKNSAVATAGLMVSAPVAKKGFAKNSPNDTINVAVVGIRSRGRTHCSKFSRIPNVNVVAICDIDKRLFRKVAAGIEDITGKTPKTVVDFRELLDDKDIDAVSIATPDHWHALQTVWACQAGKDVYVEKPLSYNIDEGRKMVQAARKYNRVVQTGTNHVGRKVVKAGIKFVREGKLGEIYMGRVIIFGGRGNIGHVKDSTIPDGVDWNLFLGPAPYRPFNENRFHYKWHWFWDYSTTEFGNNGVHYMDMVRRGLNKRVHPIKIHCTGGYYIYDSDQEIPNIQTATYEYEDGIITQLEVRSLFTNPEAGSKGGCFLYGSDGWMHLSSNGYKTYFGPKDEPGPSMSSRDEVHQPTDPEAKGLDPHFTNFIDCVRSRRWQDLNADILEGHMSTTICHLGNISYRTGRKLTFNPYSEIFIDDDDANSYLTREYRQPYAVPDEV